MQTKADWLGDGDGGVGLGWATATEGWVMATAATGGEGDGGEGDGGEGLGGGGKCDGGGKGIQPTIVLTASLDKMVTTQSPISIMKAETVSSR